MSLLKADSPFTMSYCFSNPINPGGYLASLDHVCIFFCKTSKDLCICIYIVYMYIYMYVLSKLYTTEVRYFNENSEIGVHAYGNNLNIHLINIMWSTSLVHITYIHIWMPRPYWVYILLHYLQLIDCITSGRVRHVGDYIFVTSKKPLYAQRNCLRPRFDHSCVVGYMPSSDILGSSNDNSKTIFLNTS